jgi:hypothetical protein
MAKRIPRRGGERSRRSAQTTKPKAQSPKGREPPSATEAIRPLPGAIEDFASAAERLVRLQYAAFQTAGVPDLHVYPDPTLRYLHELVRLFLIRSRIAAQNNGAPDQVAEMLANILKAIVFISTWPDIGEARNVLRATHEWATKTLDEIYRQTARLSEPPPDFPFARGLAASYDRPRRHAGAEMLRETARALLTAGQPAEAVARAVAGQFRHVFPSTDRTLIPDFGNDPEIARLQDAQVTHGRKIDPETLVRRVAKLLGRRDARQLFNYSDSAVKRSALSK